MTTAALTVGATYYGADPPRKRVITHLDGDLLRYRGVRADGSLGAEMHWSVAPFVAWMRRKGGAAVTAD